ncbi:sensory rhodopsin [Halorientalis persicus]|uniref:Sensory rhodopsin n=1 Tax=Halorientalis persicus TaxID=1367881 RepID=A0A1H8JGS5_9EURY|nr:bacteriorhodopsin [Halorientalis persicus]SEN79516.1 sensory rhodopsin [Halorientalis persicus]
MTDITTWFTLGTLGMIGGTLAMGYALWRAPGERAREDWLLIGVGVTAAVAYALLSAEIGTLQAMDGHTVYVVRYIDWLLTTPMHVAYLALLVGVTGRYLWEVAGVQALTIVLGLAGAYVEGPLKWILFAAGGLAFVRVLYLLYGPITDAARTGNEDVAGTHRTLLNFIAVLWLIYPVIWVLAQSGLGLLDLETQALVVTYIDVVAKIGFGLIALNGRAVSSLVGSDDAAPAAEDVSTAD